MQAVGVPRLKDKAYQPRWQPRGGGTADKWEGHATHHMPPHHAPATQQRLFCNSAEASSARRPPLPLPHHQTTQHALAGRFTTTENQQRTHARTGVSLQGLATSLRCLPHRVVRAATRSVVRAATRSVARRFRVPPPPPCARHASNRQQSQPKKSGAYKKQSTNARNRFGSPCQPTESTTFPLCAALMSCQPSFVNPKLPPSPPRRTA